jgi:hypothetical protein
MDSKLNDTSLALLMAGRRLLAREPAETGVQASVLGAIVLAGCAIESVSNDLIRRRLPDLLAQAPRRHRRWIEKDRLLRRPGIERYRSLALAVGISPAELSGGLMDDVEAVELLRSVVLGDHVDPSTYRERVIRARLGPHLDPSRVATVTVDQLTPSVAAWAIETAQLFLEQLVKTSPVAEDQPVLGEPG